MIFFGIFYYFIFFNLKKKKVNNFCFFVIFESTMQVEPALPVPSKRKHPLHENGSEIPAADHLDQTAEPAANGEEEQMNEEVKVKKMKSSGEGEGGEGTPAEQNDDVVKEFDMAEILVEARQHRAKRDGAKTEGKLPLISIIIPIYNAQRYIYFISFIIILIINIIYCNSSGTWTSVSRRSCGRPTPARSRCPSTTTAARYALPFPQELVRHRS
jgi:hypothetical protein